MGSPLPDRRARLIDTAQLIVAISLASYLVVGVVAWTWMIIDGIAVPGPFGTVIATIAGGLLGQLTMVRNQSRDGRSVDGETARGGDQHRVGRHEGAPPAPPRTMVAAPPDDSVRRPGS
jgi:hypothetical protein